MTAAGSPCDSVDMIQHRHGPDHCGSRALIRAAHAAAFDLTTSHVITHHRPRRLQNTQFPTGGIP